MLLPRDLPAARRQYRGDRRGRGPRRRARRRLRALGGRGMGGRVRHQDAADGGQPVVQRRAARRQRRATGRVGLPRTPAGRSMCWRRWRSRPRPRARSATSARSSRRRSTDVAAGDVVVFPAHGVTAEVRAEAARRGATVDRRDLPDGCAGTDGSEPHSRSRPAARADQPARPRGDGPITSQAPGPRRRRRDARPRRRRCKSATPGNVSYLMQPGIALETGGARSWARCGRGTRQSRQPCQPMLCYAPSDRAGTIYSVALGSDLMLVLGDPQSPDAEQVCAQAATPAPGSR